MSGLKLRAVRGMIETYNARKRSGAPLWRIRKQRVL